MSVPNEISPNDIKNPFKRDEIISTIPEFVEVYSKRPIKDNSGGMKFNHCFAVWFMAKKLNPKFIIESGTWYGQSTWLLENACPSAKIFCLDINFSRLHYKSKSATYIQKDFSTIDWSGIEPEKTLCFFDDHQNQYQRLKEACWIGIKNIIFDDNYSPNEGDVYSLRKILSGTGHTNLVVPRKYDLNPIYRLMKLLIIYLSNNFFKHNQLLLVDPNLNDRNNFLKKINSYVEFPPVFIENISKNETILQKNTPLLNSLQSIQNLEKSFDSDDYFNIGYVQLI
tara:strand:+ start:1178 stop:2023 length:846 start_codon:yes stop_codon:yes gene_type:complete